MTPRTIKSVLVVLLVVILGQGGYILRLYLQERAEAPSGSDGGREVLYWKAPMDPTFVRDAPGKSPMGMDLVPVSWLVEIDLPNRGINWSIRKSQILAFSMAVSSTSARLTGPSTSPAFCWTTSLACRK